MKGRTDRPVDRPGASAREVAQAGGAGSFPGQALIQFKAYGNEDDGHQIEQALDLGLATTASVAGRVWTRRFQRGWVAANAGATSASVTIPLRGHVRSDTGAGRRVVRGARIVVAPHDALYVTSS